MRTHCSFELPISGLVFRALMNPTLKTLQKFLWLPGSICMLEATVRNLCVSTTAIKMSEIWTTVSSTLRNSLLFGNAATLPLCISLVATLRKQLFRSNQPAVASNEQQQHEKIPDAAVAKEADEKLAYLIEFCLKLGATMSKSVSTKASRYDAERNSPTVLSSDTFTTDMSTFRVHKILQLESILHLTMVQLCHNRLGCDPCILVPQQPTPNWLKDCISQVDTVSECLKHTVHAALEGSLPCAIADQAGVGCIWERHAVFHFDGRLVPGCCHLGCTNMCGVSEATLMTQLCSGCRRARFAALSVRRLHGWEEVTALSVGSRTVCWGHNLGYQGF